MITYRPMHLDKTEILFEFSSSIYKAHKSYSIAGAVQGRQEQLYSGCHTRQARAPLYRVSYKADKSNSIAGVKQSRQEQLDTR